MRHRILQVITPSRLAGAEMLLVRLAPRLRARGHYEHIVCNRSSRSLQHLCGALQDVGFGVAPLDIGGKLNVRALPTLLRARHDADCDLMHSHLSSANWWSGWLDELGLCPSVGHVHGFSSARWHRRHRLLIACSHAVKQHLVEQGIDAARVRVLHNPVAAEDILPQRSAVEVRAQFGADGSTPIVGSFAHLSEKKGWRELFAAIPAVLRAQPRTQFWCVGDGPLREELEALAAVIGFAANVRFFGFRRDVADLMNAIDVMALPSHREPFGLVYIEAALLGKPVVACAAGGAPEVVQHNTNGLLVPPHDSTATANAIIQLLSDRTLASAMGTAGREQARERFGWEPFLRGLEAAYDAVTAPSVGVHGRIRQVLSLAHHRPAAVYLQGTEPPLAPRGDTGIERQQI